MHDITPDEWERIERFLANELPEEERTAFAAQLATDPVLLEKTENVRLVLVGVQEAALEEKLTEFHKTINKRSQRSNKTSSRLLRKWLVAASVLLLVAAFAWWYNTRQENYQQLYAMYYKQDPGLATVMSSQSNYTFEKAMVEYKNGEYDKAIKSWNSLLKEKPGNDTIVYFLGAASQASGDGNLAIEHLRRIALDTASAFNKDACWYLGLSYLKKGDTKMATTYLEKSGRPESGTIIKAINKK